MTQATLNEAKLREWIGKSQSSSDTLHAKQAQLMQLTLDREPSLQTGDALPPVWHWAYFLSGSPMSQLGRDGHAAVGEFLPPVSLPRRMWAGGRLIYTKPVHLGEHITKNSFIKDVTLKHGKSGALVFVTVRHEYFGSDDDLRFTEEHDIVYREDPSPEAPKPAAVPPPAKSAHEEIITPSTVQLFRYSALTFNGHRIHYDRDYCKEVEGYPGLIFHGPLTATLLADLAVRRHPGKQLKSFSFRAVAPLFDTQSFTIHHDGDALVWAQTPDGGLAMKASFDY
ncbi:MAG: acyl-CoA dehydrogenase [Rhizobiaceae bacterium]|nr:acyl-CoA dehydrogenase [Rhizobiaceae bacterium]